MVLGTVRLARTLLFSMKQVRRVKELREKAVKHEHEYVSDAVCKCSMFPDIQLRSVIHKIC